LAFKNGAHIGTGISALWFSTSVGTFHYRNWDSTMVPVPVLDFLYFDSLSVLARVITGTGIQWRPFQYWHFGTLIQYHYRHVPLPVLVFNMVRTGNGISALWFSTGMGIVHYRYWHSTMVPVLVWAFFHFGSVLV
jgi:ABC-type uncharacterized transport system permease subunit